MNKYLVKIFTKYLQTKFEIESDKEINDVDELNKYIIDFLGKSDINWEENDLQYTSTVNDFYIKFFGVVVIIFTGGCLWGTWRSVSRCQVFFIGGYHTHPCPDFRASHSS